MISLIYFLILLQNIYGSMFLLNLEILYCKLDRWEMSNSYNIILHLSDLLSPLVLILSSSMNNRNIIHETLNIFVLLNKSSIKGFVIENLDVNLTWNLLWFVVTFI